MNRLSSNLFLLISIFLFSSSCYCQEKIFDTAAVRESKDWQDIHYSNFSLSPDGRYAFYVVENHPGAGSYTLTIISSDQQWKKELIDFYVQSVTKDSKWCVIRKRDSLGLLKLGTEELQWLTSVAQSELVEQEDKSCLVYRNDTSYDLVLRNLDNGLEQKWAGCKDFQLGPGRKKLLWQSEEHRNGQLFYSLQWMELADRNVYQITRDMPSAATEINWGKEGSVIFFTVPEATGANRLYSLHRYELSLNKDEVIWQHAIKPDRLVFDKMGQQLLILAPDSLWCWRKGLATELLVTKQTKGLEDAFGGAVPRLSADGKHVLWQIGTRQQPSVHVSDVGVNVWHYRDKVLPPVQSRGGYHVYGITLTIASRKVLRIEKEGEELTTFVGKYALVQRRAAFNDWCWQDTGSMGFYLVSLENGDRHRLPIDNRYIDPIVQSSPAEDYIIYYDPAGDGYNSYEIATGKVRNLTRGLGVYWRKEEYYRYFNFANPFFRKGSQA